MSDFYALGDGVLVNRDNITYVFRGNADGYDNCRTVTVWLVGGQHINIEAEDHAMQLTNFLALQQWLLGEGESQ